MAFSETRILTTQELANLLVEAKNNKQERYCFILGAGASKESRIPTGNEMEMEWMNCIMGEAPHFGMPPMDPATMEKRADALHNEKKLKYRFSEIKSAWEKARKKGETTLPSKYYFDLYRLRFYTNPRSGYSYLESVMEGKQPSIGYHTLSMLLSITNQNNLVITTNFDSLTEDALFLYSKKKPLVISHESLAGFISVNIQRPIVAKLHRGLMFDPFNSPDTTDELRDEWKTVLTDAFKSYTPIVVGYGGGDGSLMSFLKSKEVTLERGIYWCYMEKYGQPDSETLKMLEKKNGFLVKIDGFDALMLKLGIDLFGEEMTPTKTAEFLNRQCDERLRSYEEQFNALKDQLETNDSYRTISETEAKAVEKKEAEGSELTALDYYRRANRFYDENEYKKAIADYDQAIRLDSDYVFAYNNRGLAYGNLKQYDKAIADYDQAIQLNPDYAKAYYNRGNAYADLKQYDKAIADYDQAIRLNPDYAAAYNNRGTVYDDLKQYDKAIADYDQAIRLNSKYIRAYNNRADAYRYRNQPGDIERAEADEATAAKLEAESGETE